MAELHDGRDGRDGRDTDSGYMRAQFEQIVNVLCELKPLPAMVATLQKSVETLVEQVKGHDVTLYGEKLESGLVGRVERVEAKINQIWGIAGMAGAAVLLWIVGRIFGLIAP